MLPPNAPRGRNGAGLRPAIAGLNPAEPEPSPARAYSGGAASAERGAGRWVHTALARLKFPGVRPSGHRDPAHRAAGRPSGVRRRTPPAPRSARSLPSCASGSTRRSAPRRRMAASPPSAIERPPFRTGTWRNAEDLGLRLGACLSNCFAVGVGPRGPVSADRCCQPFSVRRRASRGYGRCRA